MVWIGRRQLPWPVDDNYVGQLVAFSGRGYRRSVTGDCGQHWGDVRCSSFEKVIQRLMKQECLVVAAIRRRRYGSYLGEISAAPDNLINRDFQAATPNEKWLTDITEFQIPAGKVYLSPMIDCFDGLVVSWSIGTRPDADLVNTPCWTLLSKE